MRSVYLGLLILLIFSCKNPFSTRTPDGGGNNNGRWEFPGSPEIVIDNLKWAYEDRIISNYSSCFKSDFTFSPSDEDSSHFPIRFSNWDLTVELEATRLLFGIDTLTLILSPDMENHDIVSDTSALLYRDYILIASQSSFCSSSEPCEGTSIFRLAKDESDSWSIEHWKDRGSANSWGLLKQEYRP